MFVFTIYKRENVQNQKIALNFGEIKSSFKPENVFVSPSEEYWMIETHQIELGSLVAATDAQVVLVSDLQYFRIPHNIYHRVMTYFTDNWICSAKESDTLKCLCNNGISRSFPTFNIRLR